MRIADIGPHDPRRTRVILERPTIVAPDTSHWANWIDAAVRGGNASLTALDLHERLLRGGRVPFLSMHHIEELLVVDDPVNASARIRFLRSLPLVAWMQTPGDVGLGSIVDILAAEAVAYDAGHGGIADIRDYVRMSLMRVGPGEGAVGVDGWVWDVARQAMRERRAHVGMVAALSGMRSMDDTQTFGELCGQSIRTPAEREEMLSAMHKAAFVRSQKADARRSDAEAFEFANEFVARVVAQMPGQDVPVRQLLIDSYVKRGLDEHEVNDGCTIAELSTLGTFRSQLLAVAEKTGLPFERLKRVKMESLPSWRIADALRRHGQERASKPGSDVHDQHLAALAAYTDVLFVDKRTLEDFRRVRQKEPGVAALFGEIRRASDFSAVAG